MNVDFAGGFKVAVKGAAGAIRGIEAARRFAALQLQQCPSSGLPAAPQITKFNFTGLVLKYFGAS